MRRCRLLHQREESFLQDVLRLAVAQAQRPAIKYQPRRLRCVELFKPVGMFVAVHGFTV